MKTLTWAVFVAGFMAASPAALAGAGEDASRVGNLGQLGKIAFEGQKFFTEQELRRVLRAQMDYVLASDPDQPVPPLLQILEKLLRTGYQASGFADAKVVASLNADSSQVVVRITEGPRFYGGEMLVKGLNAIGTNAFVEIMQQQLRGTATNCPPNKSFKGTKSGHPLWATGAPASLDPASWARAELLVTNALWRLGHFLPQFTVDFPRREARPLAHGPLTDTNSLSAEDLQNLKAAAAEGRLVDMVIEISNEGPKCSVAGIRVYETRNSEEDIAKFLGFQPGEPFTEEWRQRQLDRLLESGRFTRATGSQEGGEVDGRVTAIFHLEDLMEAPLLTNALSANADTLLRMRRWMLDWTNRTEDLVCQLGLVNRKTGNSNTVELICSPRGDLAFQSLSRQIPATNLTPDSLFIVTPGRAGFWMSEVGAKYLNTNFNAALQLGVDATVSSKPEEDRDRGNLTFFFGFNSDTENKPPLALTLKAMAAAMVHLAENTNFIWRSEQDCLVGSHSNVCFRVHQASARLMSLHAAWDTPPGMTNWNASGQVDFSFQPGRFARAESDWTRATEKLENVYEPGHPLASGLAYMTRGVCESRMFGKLFPTNAPPETIAQARKVLPKLFSPEFFAGAEKFLPDLTPPPGNHMATPYLSEDLSQQAVQALHSLIAMFLAQVPEVAPANTWLEAAFKFPLLSLAGHGSHLDPLMNRLVNGQQLGPVASFVLASEISNPRAKRQLAITGLVESTPEGFLKDTQVLMDENAALGQMAACFLRSLVRLDENEREALCSLLSERNARLLRDATLALRQGGKPPRETIEPLLEQWWSASLKDAVKAELRKLTRVREG